MPGPHPPLSLLSIGAGLPTTLNADWQPIRLRTAAAGLHPFLVVTVAIYSACRGREAALLRASLACWWRRCLVGFSRCL